MNGGVGPRRVVAYVPDLLDRSRLVGVGEIVHVASPAELVRVAADRDLVVVDLSRPGVLDVLGSIGGEVIGFASHVDHELIAAATAAGCSEVLPRSRFFAGWSRRVGTEPDA